MSLDITLCSRQTCPSCGHQFGRDVEIHSQNITHNLRTMAMEAGIYTALWHPNEAGIETAGQLIEPLEKAITEMKANPARFEALDSPSGWGLYKHFVPWLERLLEACKDNPGSAVEVSV